MTFCDEQFLLRGWLELLRSQWRMQAEAFGAFVLHVVIMTPVMVAPVMVVMAPVVMTIMMMIVMMMPMMAIPMRLRSAG